MTPARDRGTPDDRGDDFDAIVAAWRDEGSVPDWPSAPADGAPAADRAAEGAVHRPGPAAPPPEADDHYHPPEPPPLPRPGPPVVVGGGLIAVGLLLCVAPGLLGVGGTWPLPLGLVLIASGLGWLLLRLWNTEPGEDGPDPFDDGSRI
ncbi:hypothetical protein [Pseudonocardia spirodelae]|uniref:DUF308 domain-containing protein n=1 Tax=Pseudonocardia spirodelae TaxID=3133431 RepID=A0ABU8T762_9PSEU